MDSKLKHLDMIQDTIKRMANNSFLLKGWTVTLAAALVALLAKEGDYKYLLITFFPIICFWLLDGYYLRQERMFRKLFDVVRIKDSSSIDFSMDTKLYSRDVESWLKTCFSSTIMTFYIGLFVTVLTIIVLIA